MSGTLKNFGQIKFEFVPFKLAIMAENLLILITFLQNKDLITRFNVQVQVQVY